MRHRMQYFAALVVCLLFASVAHAQWSSNPMVNLGLAIKRKGNDQVQPKVKPLANGSWWVSWFDSDPSTPPPIGYDVYIQLLAPNGDQQFRQNGLLVADLSNSSTEDYGLDFDTQGNALLAFLDTREGPNQQVTAAKISQKGVAGWGTRGVQLTNNFASNNDPKIAGTTDGGAVVGWTSNNVVVLQKLSPLGKTVWGAAAVLGASGYDYVLSDLHAADNGSVIGSIVRNKGFGSPNNLLAFKLSSAGKPLWGTSPVVVYDAGSLQFGNFPYFVPDGSGGAVFGWYSSTPTLQVFAQHILSDGSLAFPPNGSVGSMNTVNVRVSPSVTYDATSGNTFLFWTEEDSFQALNGVSGQEFDSSGNLLWGDDGLTIVPLGSDQQIFVKTVLTGQGPLVYWVDSPSFTTGTLEAIELSEAGGTVCAEFPVSNISAEKDGLSAGITPAGLSAVAWQDYRNSNSQIYIQNVNPNCSLGQ
jgi:hypothetical protein